MGKFYNTNTILFLVSAALLTNMSQAVYYYSNKGFWNCFRDTVVANYTLEMEVIIMDEPVLENIVKANDIKRAQGATVNEGARLRLLDPNDNQLFFGDVHPNVQYEYETTEAGQYTLCV